MAHATSDRTKELMDLEARHGARNYSPLPVVLERGEGVFVWDVDGKRYYDMLSAYSALNQGHNHPRIVAAAQDQLQKLTLTSRAFHNNLLGPFVEKLSGITRKEKILPMNSGAEAVETAIKAMRKWGYTVKGIPAGKAEIIVCEENFHGRTTTIVGFSSDPDAYEGYGPATPGFVRVPYGDADALERAITPNTCGFLVEPIQGEAGVNIPPAGYLKRAREICAKQRVLLCCDEIQTGLGRTGAMFCADHENVTPDLFILGKALSGGLYPISAVAADAEVMDVFTPGTHGSTYGGNPLACAIGMAALDVLIDENLAERAKKSGARFLARLQQLKHPKLIKVRGKGLFLALEFSEALGKPLCKLLMKQGLLAKDTHATIVRFAPPLIISDADVDAACDLIEKALKEL